MIYTRVPLYFLYFLLFPYHLYSLYFLYFLGSLDFLDSLDSLDSLDFLDFLDSLDFLDFLDFLVYPPPLKMPFSAVFSQKMQNNLHMSQKRCIFALAFGALAHLVERFVRNEEVGSSSLLCSTPMQAVTRLACIFFDMCMRYRRDVAPARPPKKAARLS